MKKKNLIWLIVVIILIATVSTILIVSKGRKELNINTRTASISTIETTVMATGYVQPVDKVEVGTQVSGVIERIYVDYNSLVKKGQLLAELDKLTLAEKVSQANASLISSRSDLTYAKQNYERTNSLYQAKAATQVAWEQSVNSLSQAESAVTNAEANLHQAQVNLSYADITSPIDGIVLERAVEEGQTVAASFSTPTLFTIANDLTKMQVEADVDEADIGSVRLGQPVTFTVDAYSDIEFTGEVTQIRLQPVVTNNVVTYTVIVEAPNPDEKLFPGMTANITIVTESETGLTVPAEALALRMTDEVLEQLPHQADQPAAAQGGQGVWIYSNGTAAYRPVKTGIGDGVNTIITSGLNPGEEVILSAAYEKNTKQTGKAAANPLMPQRGGRR